MKRVLLSLMFVGSLGLSLNAKAVDATGVLSGSTMGDVMAAMLNQFANPKNPFGYNFQEEMTGTSAGAIILGLPMFIGVQNAVAIAVSFAVIQTATGQYDFSNNKEFVVENEEIYSSIASRGEIVGVALADLTTEISLRSEREVTPFEVAEYLLQFIQ